MATNPSYPDQALPSDPPEIADAKRERLVARNSTLRILDISDKSSAEHQAALAFARKVALFTNASGADVLDGFEKFTSFALQVSGNR